MANKLQLFLLNFQLQLTFLLALVKKIGLADFLYEASDLSK